MKIRLGLILVFIFCKPLGANPKLTHTVRYDNNSRVSETKLQSHDSESFQFDEDLSGGEVNFYPDNLFENIWEDVTYDRTETITTEIQGTVTHTSGKFGQRHTSRLNLSDDAWYEEDSIFDYPEEEPGYNAETSITTFHGFGSASIWRRPSNEPNIHHGGERHESGY